MFELLFPSPPAPAAAPAPALLVIDQVMVALGVVSFTLGIIVLAYKAKTKRRLVTFKEAHDGGVPATSPSIRSGKRQSKSPQRRSSPRLAVRAEQSSKVAG